MALVGLLETLLTLNLTDEITESRGYPDRECVALGAANMVSGVFGGMGGCAMIGQTVINLSSGGRGRLSGVVAGVMILLFILFLSPLIERIPLAALVGVMFVVSQQTFAWASLRVVNKVPLNDVLVIIAVTVITVFTDLATAVLCGIIIAALNFAWQQARELYADSHLEADGSKLYRLHGTLFFASTAPFLNQFDPANDPAAGDARLSPPELRRLLGHRRAQDLTRALHQGRQAPAGAALVRTLQETAQARPRESRLKANPAAGVMKIRLPDFHYSRHAHTSARQPLSLHENYFHLV